jgi:NADPH-dependent 2,4-dienoyl-CoA reductase/sulfur reductase-like enzyme
MSNKQREGSRRWLHLLKIQLKSKTETRKYYQEIIKSTILIVGGGLTGVAAALAARRNGADVLLVEHYGFFGRSGYSGHGKPLYAISGWRKADNRREY